MQKDIPKSLSITCGPLTLVVINEEDSDYDDIEAPPFSPISVDENFDISDSKHGCSVSDPESTDTNNEDDDIENNLIDDLVIHVMQSVSWHTYGYGYLF